VTSIATSKAPVVTSGLWSGLRERGRLLLLLAVVVVWVALWAILRGQDTLPLPPADTTPLHDWLQAKISDLQLHSTQYPLMQAAQHIAAWLNSLIGWLQGWLSTATATRPVPQIGWLGVVAIAGWFALTTAGWRIAVFVVACFMAFGMLGFWAESIDTLIITFTAVAMSVIIGLPLGVWMGTSKAVNAIVTPVLDVMQTMPSFAYLLPFVVLFQIGSASAVLVTFVYAVPPIVRITAFGIRGVSTAAVEATDSLGQTPMQRLTKVQMPMARRTIIVGLNQTTMAALSMATIAALIAGPGLGIPVIQALAALQVGQAFVPGLCIVIMAIMLDRATTAISTRPERLARAGGGNQKARWIASGVAGLVALVAVYLSHIYLQLSAFPARLDVGAPVERWVQSAANWVSTHLSGVTTAFKNEFSTYVLNPVQNLVANSPWWLTGAVICAIAVIVGGRWALLSATVCLAGIRVLGMWQDSMVTMTSVIGATLLVMILAAVFGVWMGRSRVVDGVLRPVLDAGQTLPPFVYLVPVLALFGPTRFTAIIAAVAYAAPAAIKLVADGVRGIAPATVEAATAAGSTSWQLVRKVQLPMARSSFVLAANQGLLYVLAMVVIGGLVGGGALGYDVVAGFQQSSLNGKGLAAGVTIVLLGVMLDRITRYAATRNTASGGSAVGYA
jgi:glycine betaine/proline transport system permease protein